MLEKLNPKLLFAYLFAISPLIFNHLPALSNNFPHWAILVLLANIVSFVSLIYILFVFIKNRNESQDYSFLLAFLLPVLLVIILIVRSNNISNFIVFGKGVSTVSVAIIFSLVPIIFLARILSLKIKKVLFVSSLISLFITVSVFIIALLFNYLKISFNLNYLFYLIQPTLAFGGLFNYPFFYALACIIGVSIPKLISKFNKTSIIFSYVNIVLATLLTMFMFVWSVHNFTRYVAANYYLDAVKFVKRNDLDGAINKLNKANSIAPFDSYYIGLAELKFIKLQSMDPEKEETANMVASIINDLSLAYNYDQRNDLPLVYLFNFFNFLGAPNQSMSVLQILKQKYPEDKNIDQAMRELQKLIDKSSSQQNLIPSQITPQNQIQNQNNNQNNSQKPNKK